MLLLPPFGGDNFLSAPLEGGPYEHARMRGKILITGSFSGLGRATAELFASKVRFDVREGLLSGFRNGGLETSNGKQLPLRRIQLEAIAQPSVRRS
jgi:hypothetical protein